MIRIGLLLTIVTSLIALNLSSRNASAEVTGMPNPYPTPAQTRAAPAPWDNPQAVAEATRKLQEEKETLSLAMAEVVKDATTNGQESEAVAKAVLPKIPALEQAIAAEKATEAEIDGHDGRCHAAKLEPGPYSACVTEHNSLWGKYKDQVATRQSLAREILPLQQKLEAFEARDKEYRRQWEAAKARTVEIEKSLAQLAEIEAQLVPCKALEAQCTERSCPAGIQQGLRHCWTVFFDGAKAGLPPISADPQLPFVMTPNGGDSGVVDSRGVQKMTAAEREAEQKKPRVAPYKGKGGSPPPKP
jgi:hypothetical protein